MVYQEVLDLVQLDSRLSANMDFYLVRNAFQNGRYEIRDSLTRLEVAVGDTPPMNIDEISEKCCKVCGIYNCAVHANWVICSCSGNWKYDPTVYQKCPGCGVPPPHLNVNHKKDAAVPANPTGLGSHKFEIGPPQ